MQQSHEAGSRLAPRRPFDRSYHSVRFGSWHPGRSLRALGLTMDHQMILHCDLGENHQLKVVVAATQPQQALRIQRHEASTRNDANGTTRTLSAQGSTTTRPHPNRSRIVSAQHPCSIRAASAPYPRRIRAVSAPYPEASRIAEFKRSRMLAWPHRSNYERLLYGCCAAGVWLRSGCCAATVRMLCS